MAKKFDVNNMFSEQSDEPSKGTLEDLFGEDFGNDIFSNAADNRSLMSLAKEIDIKKLKPSPRNPYKVLDNDDMESLVASISSEGILNPIIARPIDGGLYEIISGHRRLHAAELLKLKKVPVVIKEMTDEQADVWIVDLNLNRETILPSEKAKAIKLKYDAIKRSHGGARKPVGENEKRHDSAELIAEEMGMTDRNLRRYLLLANLSDELLDKVDSKELTQKAAEQISHLTSGMQKKINRYIEQGENISQDVAKQLKLNFANVDNVDDKDLNSVLKGKVKKPVKAKSIIIKMDKEIQKINIEPSISEKDKGVVLEKINEIRAKLNELEEKLQ